MSGLLRFQGAVEAHAPEARESGHAHLWVPLMVSEGTVTVTVAVDASRVIDVLTALSTLERIAASYGHIWTPEELVVLQAARAACERKHLAMAGD